MSLIYQYNVALIGNGGSFWYFSEGQVNLSSVPQKSAFSSYLPIFHQAAHGNTLEFSFSSVV